MSHDNDDNTNNNNNNNNNDDLPRPCFPAARFQALERVLDAVHSKHASTEHSVVADGWFAASHNGVAGLAWTLPAEALPPDSAVVAGRAQRVRALTVLQGARELTRECFDDDVDCASGGTGVVWPIGMFHPGRPLPVQGLAEPLVVFVEPAPGTAEPYVALGVVVVPGLDATVSAVAVPVSFAANRSALVWHMGRVWVSTGRDPAIGRRVL